MRSVPKARQRFFGRPEAGRVAAADDKDLRVRFYIVDLTPPKLVSLEVAHTVKGARSPQFTVRVRPLKEPN